MGRQAEWIAVDWGTTHLRAWSMSGTEVLDKTSSDAGMNCLSPSEFEPALLSLIADWLPAARSTQVLCCGMVGSRQGWTEAPYRPVPCVPSDSALVHVPTQDARINVHILPGLSQSKPADVMRGEETQITGFINLNPGWDGVLCLPGTHSKWVHISAGEVVSFQTFLTGEMFALLADHSVLRHSVASPDWDAPAFAVAVSDAMSRPEQIAARLFRLRADDLLNQTSNAAARATLSGLLIGAELAATKPYWLGQQVGVIGADALARAYTKALEAQGVAVTLAKGDAMTLAGLVAARRTLEITV